MAYKTDDFLKELHFIWNFLRQNQKKVTFQCRWLLNTQVLCICITVKSFLCELPREQWNMVTLDRWSLNTGLIEVKCNVKGNINQGHIIQVIA